MPIADRFSVAITEYERRDFSLVDVNGAGCSKGTTLARWATSRGLSAAEVMAVGDNLNDVEMLDFAGTAVVMGNATDALKARGYRLTGTNDEGGLAAAIRSFALKGKHRRCRDDCRENVRLCSSSRERMAVSRPFSGQISIVGCGRCWRTDCSGVELVGATPGRMPGTAGCDTRFAVACSGIESRMRMGVSRTLALGPRRVFASVQRLRWKRAPILYTTLDAARPAAA